MRFDIKVTAILVPFQSGEKSTICMSKRLLCDSSSDVLSFLLRQILPYNELDAYCKISDAKSKPRAPAGVAV